MILLWGLQDDGPLAAVRRELERSGAEVLFIDQRRTPQHHLALEANCGRFGGSLSHPGGATKLEQIHAVYPRPYDITTLDGLEILDERPDMLAIAAEFERRMLAWLDHTPAVVVNRPSAMTSNASKPFQLELIRAAGWLVPPTLVTTSASDAHDWWDRHQRCIYKSISSQRSIVSELSPDHRLRLDDVAWCPTQFQKRIDGVDYRVHVIDDCVYATRITSSGDDYRYDTSTHLDWIQLPDDVSCRCIELARSLELRFAGIDLRRTPADDWYCFEVNPSPGFTYFADATGQPIAEQLATILCDQDGGQRAIHREEAAPARGMLDR